MSSLFHIQKEGLQVMDHMFQEERKQTPRDERTNSGFLSSTGSNGGEDGKEQAFHSPMLTVVKRNVDEVQRLDHFAERASNAVSSPHPQ